MTDICCHTHIGNYFVTICTPPQITHYGLSQHPLIQYYNTHIHTIREDECSLLCGHTVMSFHSEQCFQQFSLKENAFYVFS